MTVTYREGLSILELIVYAPSLIMALVLGYRHGYSRSAGWYFFIIFSLLRMIGNACYLATINDPNNDNLYITYAVCNSIGLTPILMSLLALLSRLNESIVRRSGSGYWPQMFRAVSLLTLAGVILSIVGISNASSLTGGVKSIEMKVAMIIYAVSWVAIVFFTVLIGFRYGSIEKGEHRLLAAIIACMPLLAVRLAYSLLAVFSNMESFNMFYGNTTVFLVMDLLEEIAIVYIILLTGMTLGRRSPYNNDVTKTGAQQQQQRGGYSNVELQETLDTNAGYAGPNNAQASRPPFQPRPYHGGPIHRLFQFLSNKLDESRYNHYGAQ